MSYQLDPKILSKLRAFAARRRKLIILRGVFTAVAMLLATMMLVALIDWIFILPDEARWGLSAAAYLAVIIVEWRTCLSVLAHAPGPRRLARLLEHAEPKLREDLLSAVELGTAPKGEVFDSPQFRALVQTDVAARVEHLDVEQLLPVRLLKRYLAFAAAIVLALIVAFSATGLQFGTLLMRALMPLGNFARVSRFQVEIVEPTPAERLVPQGDAVPLLVAVTGGRASKAYLETFTKSGGRELIPMAPLEGDRFSATIQVARENMDYRVRVGDAITRKYRLEAAARPVVVKFEKSYQYPAYTKMSARQVSEENGDLAGLEGTIVELRLRTNQPIEQGALRIEQGKTRTDVPLERDGDFLVGRLPLTASGTYRVHLIGAASGFENKFAPQYEIRAEPDLIPQVELELPKQDLILPANEVVDIRGNAKDDQAIAKVAQMTRINDGAWEEAPLVENSGPEIRVERRWSLHEQGVKPGDLLAIKLVAFDLKGNKAESRLLRLTITNAGFGTKRLQALEARRLSWQSLKDLRTAGEAMEKQATEAREKFKQLAPESPERVQIVTVASTAMDEFERKVSEAEKLLVAALRGTEGGHESAEYVLFGRMLGRADLTTAQFGRDALNLVTAAPVAAYSADLMRDYRENARRSIEQLRFLEDSARTLLAAEEIDVLVENSGVMAQEQERLKILAENSGDDAAKWSPLGNRMRVVIAETRALELMLESAASHSPGGNPDRLKRMQKDVEKERTALEAALAQGPPSKATLKPTQDLTKATTELSRRLLEFRREQGQLPISIFADLLKQTEPTWTNLDRLRQDLPAVAALNQVPADLRTQLVGRRWAERTAIFKLHGDIEEQRPAFDPYFVGDIRTATLALQGLRIDGVGAMEPIKDKFNVFDKAFRIMECAHDISEVADALTFLATAERWEINNPKARTSSPRDWDWIELRLKALPDELGRTEAAEPTRKVIEEARNALREALRVPGAQTVAQEMKERFKPERSPTAAPQSVEQVAVQVRRALELLRAPLEEARKVVAEMAPSIKELMRQLAKETEELRAETLAQAEKTAEKPPEQSQADARQALAKQERLNEKVEALKDALRSDANKQDVFEKEGRERARDADDAVAMLKEPPPKAAEALKDAAAVPGTDEQKQSLQEAASQQEKLTAALQDLAKHYENLENAKPEETRLALREKEAALGIKEALDAQAAKAEQMAKMAKDSPEGLLAQLEKALPQNQLMQQELSGISEDTLVKAEAQLENASKQESGVAEEVAKLVAEQKPQVEQAAREAAAKEQALKDQAMREAIDAQKAAADANAAPATPPSAAPDAPALSAPQPPEAAPSNAPAPSPPSAPPAPTPAHPQLAQAAGKQKPIAAAAAQAGEDVARAGRHEERLQNALSGEQLQKLGSEIQETAKQEIAAAEKALADAPMAAPAQGAVEAAKAELGSELSQLQAAISPQGQISASPPKPEPGSPPSPASPSPPGEPGAPAAPTSATPPSTPATAPAAPAPSQPGSEPPSSLASAAPAAPNPAEPTGPASPQEQVWMARALDTLDAALNSQPPSPAQTAAGSAPPPPSASSAPPPPSPAQASLASAAQAAAAAMRAARSESAAPPAPQPSSTPGTSERSLAGAETEMPGAGYQFPGKLPAAGKNTDWGKLPKKVAEELSQGQREAVAGEYRNQVETYYRVIAERSKKP